MKFDKLHLSADLLHNLNANGYFRTTDIQFKAIPSIRNGEDVLAIAQTGTGKTAAFAIPIIDRLINTKDSKRNLGIKCLVMVPTRELAQQIGEVFEMLATDTKVKPYAVFGGVEMDPQIQKLQAGIDILITTPGRLIDLIRKKFVSLDYVETLVLDEADRMLELGFLADVEAIKRKLTHRHQTLFFSATIDQQIKKLAYSQVRSTAIRIQISPDDPVSKNVTHAVMFVEMDDKRFFLDEYLRQNAGGKFIIFVRTRVRAERVAKAMGRVNVATLTLHGEKEQTDRAEVMKAFRSGTCMIMIATDVSARGIDIPDVTHVINYDLPERPENYVHRIGRTGRGFNKGVAVSFCSEEEKPLLEQIQALLSKKIDVISVSKSDYKMIAAQPELGLSLSLQELLDSADEFEKKPKRKKK